jgi:hypothetical protein
MSRAECIIAIHITQTSELCTEGYIIRLFLCMEAQVFEKDDIARLCFGADSFNIGSDTIVCETHALLRQKLLQMLGDWLQ